CTITAEVPGIGVGFGLARCSLPFGLFLSSCRSSGRDSEKGHEIYRCDLATFDHQGPITLRIPVPGILSVNAMFQQLPDFARIWRRDCPAYNPAFDQRL